MNKPTVVHPDNVTLFSTNRKGAIKSQKKTWRRLDCILLSEGSWSGKAAYCVVPTIGLSGKGKTMEAIKRSAVGGMGREGEEGGERDE